VTYALLVTNANAVLPTAGVVTQAGVVQSEVPCGLIARTR
jgi:hypothetical protein